MGATKEKRIRKLKKMRIWPAIVGLVLLMVISALLIGVTGLASVFDIAQRKVVQAGAQAVRVAELYDQQESEALLGIDEAVLTYIELLPEIESVSIMDKAGQEVWSNNQTYPSTNRLMLLDLKTVGIEQDVRIYIEDDMNQIITVKNGTIVPFFITAVSSFSSSCPGRRIRW